MLEKFCETQNFDKIILNFTKFKENFTKHEIKNLAKFFWKLRKQKFSQPPYSYTICRLLHSTHPPLPSSKTFFIAARQCSLEMKTIKQQYFSILSSLILWTTYSIL